MRIMLQSFTHFIYSVLFGVLATFGINLQTEQPHYKVIDQIGNTIEIRQYPKRTAAEITLDAEETDNPRREAFHALAGYIFGGNKGRKNFDMTSPVEITSSAGKIPMTSPVEVNRSDKALIMRFFMPYNYLKDELPNPLDSRVKLIELPETLIANLRYSGSTGDVAVSARIAELLKALQETKWKVIGPATAFFYNPLWTLPFLRRNEVAVPISK